MGKIKKEAVEQEDEGDVTIKQEELTYEEKLENVSVIAKPMAPKKLAKKCYKLIKKGKSHHKNILSCFKRCFTNSCQTKNLL